MVMIMIDDSVYDRFAVAKVPFANLNIYVQDCNGHDGDDGDDAGD